MTVAQLCETPPCRTSQDLADLVKRSRAQRELARQSYELARRHRKEARRSSEAARRQGLESMRLNWRMRRSQYDRLHPALGVWAGRSPDDRSPARSLPELRRWTGEAEIMSLDEFVRRVSEAGLELEDCRSLADGPMLARLDLVADRLDGMIRDIRRAAFAAQMQMGPVDAPLPVGELAGFGDLQALEAECAEPIDIEDALLPFLGDAPHTGDGPSRPA